MTSMRAEVPTQPSAEVHVIPHLKRDPDPGEPGQCCGVAFSGEAVLQRPVGAVLVDEAAALGAAAHEHHDVRVAQTAQNLHFAFELVGSLRERARRAS